jgi:hypothetical protein
MQLVETRLFQFSWQTLAAGPANMAQGVLQFFTWSYWFSPGCRRSYQFSRYAFALLYLYLAWGWGCYGSRTPLSIDAYLDGRNPEMYHPLSIFNLLYTTPLPAGFYKVCLLLLAICPITLLIGFCSRLSLAGCFIGLFGIGVMFHSYENDWSHGEAPILVPTLAFLLGPAHNDGIDGWLRRRLGWFWTAADDQRARAAVLSTQLLLSLVFLNAAFYKCYAYGEGTHRFLPWVFTDNLRNVIICQHVVLGVPLEEPFRFIVTHEFAYKGLALGNMLAQTLPFAACFLMNRPYLRLLCGVVLCGEVLGLGFVMGIWNYHWPLFVAFFVDWDRLVFRAPPDGGAAPDLPPYVAPRPQTGKALLLLILVAFNAYMIFLHKKPNWIVTLWHWHWFLWLGLFVDWRRLLGWSQSAAPPDAGGAIRDRAAFHPQLIHAGILVVLLSFNAYVMFCHHDQHPWTFPFTSYPMFSMIRAERPYDQQLPYYIPVSTYEFDADEPLSEASLKTHWAYNWGMTWIPDTRAACKQMVSVLETANSCTIREMKAYRALKRIPRYPGTELKEIDRLLVYHYRDGKFQTVVSQIKYDAEANRCYVDFQAYGFDSPAIALKYVTEEVGSPANLPGVWSGGRFHYTRPNALKVIVVFEICEPNKAPVLYAGPFL